MDPTWNALGIDYLYLPAVAGFIIYACPLARLLTWPARLWRGLPVL